MGSFFRSEEMALAQLFLQPEAAYFAISELGECGVVQFRDVNDNLNVFQRKFVNEVRRCDAMERRLRYIEAEVKKDKVEILDHGQLPRAPNPKEIIDLEASLEKTECEIKELSESAVHLKSNYLELTEFSHVLNKSRSFFNEHDDSGAATEYRALMQDDGHGVSVAGQLNLMAGVISRKRVPAFERMLWRISRGNVFFRQAEIEVPLEDPVTRNEMYKTVFAVFFQGEQLKSRVKKVCAGFHASLYPFPNSNSEREELENGISIRLQDLNMVLSQTEDHRQRVLVNVARKLQNWSVMVRKMKAIYHTLNLFNMDVTKKCFIGECWVAIKDKDIVQQAINKGYITSRSSMPSFLNIINTTENPPTFNRTNKFTEGFQTLVNSYGVASYREVNPALYTIVTFPFLFAVMFGDVGHGLILTIFGAYMVIKERKLQNQKLGEIINMFFIGRYNILMMGIFSIYTGILYNDLFSKSFNIFGSYWSTNYNQSTINGNQELQLDPLPDYDQTPYPLGLDPVWQLAKNKIIFLNSFKMKLSIIIGVIHMMFGLSLSLVNHLYFRDYLSIFLQFIPQLLFLVLLFVWMVFMMFLKWIMYSAVNEKKYSTTCAPSILILFINMVLFKSTEPPDDCSEFIFDGQKEMQQAFVVLALLCIPVMLLGKPVYKALLNRRRIILPQETIVSDHGEDNSLSKELMDQSIHTIEYVLSTISHTASYLRLWALSLAHAQLSEVLWSMTIQKAFIFRSYIGAALLFPVFAFWAFCTIAILVMMEGLSAFLHTLRLHWVEFMSKFYHGLGYPFTPFNFATIIEEDDALDK